MRRSTGLVAAVLCATLATSVGRADDSDDFLAVVKSGKCPEKLEKYAPIKTSEYCLGLENRGCNDTSSACFDELSTCWNQVNTMNKQIFTYNNFIDKCKAKQ